MYPATSRPKRKPEIAIQAYFFMVIYLRRREITVPYPGPKYNFRTYLKRPERGDGCVARPLALRWPPPHESSKRPAHRPRGDRRVGEDDPGSRPPRPAPPAGDRGR